MGRHPWVVRGSGILQVLIAKITVNFMFVNRCINEDFLVHFLLVI